jgi:hypothetical protein
MFVIELSIGALMVCLTVFVHAVALDRLMVVLEIVGPAFYKALKKAWKTGMLILTVLWLFISHIVQIWLWAFLYLYLDSFSTMEEALYFSTTTFTTVGYGDLIMEPGWRLLSAFQSANGFILFGWSTAFIFEITSKLYRRDVIRKTGQ